MTTRAICIHCVEKLHLQAEWSDSEAGTLEGRCDFCGQRYPTREFTISGSRVFEVDPSAEQPKS